MLVRRCDALANGDGTNSCRATVNPKRSEDDSDDAADDVELRELATFLSHFVHQNNNNINSDNSDNNINSDNSDNNINSDNNAGLPLRLLGAIAGCARQAPQILSDPIPLLKSSREPVVDSAATTVCLTARQALCLLCLACFSLIPEQKAISSWRIQHLSFLSLYQPAGSARRERSAPVRQQKLRCIFHYFQRQLLVGKDGDHAMNGNDSIKRLITFQRLRQLRCPIAVNWLTTDNNDIHDSVATSAVFFAPKCGDCQLIRVDDEGRIEDQSQSRLQIDFANALIGGGVLRDGCVQEEIRMLISPELLCSLLFTERLEDNECLLARGTKRFCAYAGYSSTFSFAGDWRDPPGTFYQVCAMDALMFPRLYYRWLLTEEDSSLYQRSNLNLHSLLLQYQPEALDREFLKAQCAFQRLKQPFDHSDDHDAAAAATIATGNWGCGAFGGDLQLKAIIQLLAAACHCRSVEYFTFGQGRLFGAIAKGGDGEDNDGGSGGGLMDLWRSMAGLSVDSAYQWLHDYRTEILEPLLRRQDCGGYPSDSEITTLFQYLRSRRTKSL